MRFAIIENDIVVNVAISDEALADNWIASDDAGIGDQYEDGEFIKPQPNVQERWEMVRQQRNDKLAASDWTQLPDVSGIDADAWADYRQELRDVTSQPDPFNITWPIEPGA